MMHRCSYRHEFSNLPEPVRETLEDESYQTFMHQTNPALGSPAVPGPVAATVRRLLSTADFGDLISGNHPVAERLAHEAVAWCDERWAAATGAAYRNEQTELDLFRACTSAKDARKHLPPSHRERLHGLVQSMFTEDPVDELEFTARIAYIAKRWQAAIDSERDLQQTRELGRSLGSFVREMSETVPRLIKAQKLIRDLFGNENALWDGSPGEWNSTDWDAIERASTHLESHPELNRLAEILGRSRVTVRSTITTRTVHEVVTRVVGLGKSEVTGFTFGDDLTSLIPSEVALLSNPDTEELFFAKLAHRELLQFDYRRERVERSTRTKQVREARDEPVPRGPIILCIDTSGSMLGEPEMVAKAVALALCRRVETDGRDLHAIAFSTGTRSFTFRVGERDLAALSHFLSSGFHGGTDLRPALEEALVKLERDSFRDADILVVSDFRIPKIADRFIARIKDQQRAGTLFHSLTIARATVTDPLHIFDRSWLYDISTGTHGISPQSLRPIS